MEKLPYLKNGEQLLIKGLIKATKITGGILILLISGSFFLIYQLESPNSSDSESSATLQKTIAAATPKTRSSIPLAEEIVEGKDVATGLIAGEGLQIVKGNCTACHSSALILQNRFTREGWHEKIVWMQETQGLWDLGDNEAIILDYLAENYAPEEPRGRRRPLSNIEWYPLKD